MPCIDGYRRHRFEGRPGCIRCGASNPRINWAREENTQERRDRARVWRQENREQATANVQAYRRRHPARRTAWNAVYNAIKRGEMEKEPCEVCGNPEAEAHHDDYSKPLDVRWLCRDHHYERDMERRRG